MASRTMDIKLLNVTKTTAEWADSTVASTIISKGLLCIELDTNGKSWAKVGDGVHTYSQLPYITDGAVASLGNIFTIKGVVTTYENLPTTGNHAGDVYFVGDSTQTGSDVFEEYVWTTGSKWEFIGKTGEVVIPAYTGGTGISVVDGVDSKVINHTNSITAGTASGSATGTLTFGGTFDIPTVTYDAQGHITAKGTTTMTMPANPDTTYEFADNYDASTNKGATVATVTNAIAALDGGTIGTPGTGKTITALSQTDGNISATFSNISITKSQVSDFPANVVNSVTYDTTGANPQIKVASNGGTAAAIVSITDNSSTTDVTSSDTNLITARTLYYAGYIHEDDSLTLNCTL